MKKCVDCEHSFYPYDLLKEPRWLCCRVSILEKKPMSLVTGEDDKNVYWSCEGVRDLNWLHSLLFGTCNRNGKFFKPKTNHKRKMP